MNDESDRQVDDARDADESVEKAEPSESKADRRELMQKALKVGAAAPVMMALFAGRQASATGEGVSGLPFP